MIRWKNTTIVRPDSNFCPPPVVYLISISTKKDSFTGKCFRNYLVISLLKWPILTYLPRFDAMKWTSLFLLIFLLTPTARAQQAPLAELNQSRLKVQTTGMWVLTGWSVANMAYGGIAASQTTGSTRYFHRMNLYWNVVNLGIAAPSLISSLRQHNNLPTTLDESIEELHGLEKTLLFNAGLDVGYLMGGLYLLEKAKNTPDKRDRLKGFGQSVVLQGGFLLLFDAANYLALRKSHRKAAALLKNVQFTGQSVGVVIEF